MKTTLLPDGSILIFPSRGKLLLIFLGAAGFVALALFLLRLPNGPFQGVILSLFALFSIFFFGLCGLYALFRLILPVPAVVIGPAGITDRASALGVGHLPWASVKYLVPYVYQGQPMLGIVPHDLEALLKSVPRWKRSAIKANLALGCAPVNIPQIVLPGTTGDLARLIENRFGVRIAAGASRPEPPDGPASATSRGGALAREGGAMLRELALRLAALLSFCGGPLFLSNLLKPHLPPPAAFAITFAPVGLMILGAFYLNDPLDDRWSRLFVQAGRWALFAVLGMHLYALARLAGGARISEPGLYYFGIAVGGVWSVLYLRAAQRWSEPAGPSL